MRAASRCSAPATSGLSALFAATYPDRVTALVLSRRGGRRRRDDLAGAAASVFLDAIENNWGDGTLLSAVRAQSGRQPRLRRLVGADAAVGGQPRNGASADGDDHADRPAGGAADDPGRRRWSPTCTDDRIVPVEERPGGGGADPRRAVHRISRQGRLRLGPTPGARRHRGVPHRPPRRPAARVDRVLATVLFTDIVGSTARASQLGDGRWRALLDEHDRIVRAELARWRGTRDQDDRRRLPGDLRRPCPGGQLRARRSSTRSPTWACDPRGRAHGRVRAARRRRRAGSPCTSGRA